MPTLDLDWLAEQQADAESRFQDRADIYFPVRATSSVGSTGGKITYPTANYTNIPCMVQQLPRLPYQEAGAGVNMTLIHYVIKFSVNQELPKYSKVLVRGIEYIVNDTDEGILERFTLDAQCTEMG